MGSQSVGHPKNITIVQGLPLPELKPSLASCIIGNYSLSDRFILFTTQTVSNFELVGYYTTLGL